MSRDSVLLFVYAPTGSQKCPRYAFTGGNKNHGNVTTEYGRGASDISMELVEDGHQPGQLRRYSVFDITFAGPGQSQMSWRPQSKAHKAVIDNQATGPADVEYSVWIEDHQTDDLFICHPMIKNVPPVN